MARPEVTRKYPRADAAPDIEPVLLTIPICSQLLGLSPASIYRLLGLNKLQAVKAGGRTLVTMQSARDYAASLPPAKIKPPTTTKLGIHSDADKSAAVERLQRPR